MKNKYVDNKLAEEMDLIVLRTNKYRKDNLPWGSVGTLIESYRGMRFPLYGLFKTPEGNKEVALTIRGFRVLNPRESEDARIIVGYMKKMQAV